MTVNERVKLIRRTLKLTQANFSKAIYVSAGYTAGIENGRRIVNDRIIRLISLTFGASESWLKTGEGEMFQNFPLDRKQRILALFNELKPRYQEYALKLIDHLLKLQNDSAGP
jgi:transcriptional regulator with XRE-family HTH domain